MLRDRLAKALDATRVTQALLHLAPLRPRSRVTLLTYHRVTMPVPTYPFDAEVVDATPSEFDQQLRDLAKYAHVVGVTELRELVEAGKAPPNTVAITFDDGYKECVDVVLPMLQRHGLRATFFVATGNVTERRLFWWDRIAYALKRAKTQRFTLSYPKPMEVDASDPARAFKPLADCVKGTQGLDVERFVDELTEKSGAPWSRELERKYADELLMTWDDLRTLRKAGMDVQSHTRSHRVLPTLSLDEMVTEFQSSKEDLERELGETPFALAYPCGRIGKELPVIREAATRTGYKLGFSNASGVNAPSWDALNLGRVAMERGMSAAMFRGMLAVPSLWYHNAK